MSWAEVKKINSDLNTPLDKLIKNILLGGYFWTIETTPTTFIVPSGVNDIYISGTAGGGGGGGAAGMFHEDDYNHGRYNKICYGGGGGGAAGKEIDAKMVVLANRTLNLSVGLGGSGGNSRAIYDSNYGRTITTGIDGANGTDTVIGSLVIPHGNYGGKGAATIYAGQAYGGAGGAVGGAAGTGGSTTPGHSMTGTGGAGGTVSGLLLNYGNGGTGGTVSADSYGYSGSVPTINSNGTNGQQGIIIITWGAFRFADIRDSIITAIAGGATHGGSE